MKKNEYVAPEMEIVEITEKYTILAESQTGGNEEGGGGFNQGGSGGW